MCGPLATFAIGALTSIASFAAQSQEAKAMEENATQAYVNDQQQLNLRGIQEQNAAQQKLQLSKIDEAEKVAAVEVSAAEGGVAGISVGNLVADVQRRSARNRETERTNLGMLTAQLQQEKKGSQATNQGRINSTPKPSILSLVAGIGGAGLDAYNQASEGIA